MNAIDSGEGTETRKGKKKISPVVIALLIALVVLGVMIMAPCFVKNRQTACRNSCANNLRLIDAAKECWALETGQAAGAIAVTTAIDAALRGNTTPSCPSKGTYTYGRIGEKPACSIPAHTGIY